MSTEHQRRLARLACHIHDHCSSACAPTVKHSLPADAWRACQRHLRGLQKARQSGWRGTADTLQLRFHDSLVRLTFELQELLQRTRPQRPRRLVSPREMYDDLVALYDEFETVDWDRRQARLAVETGPIVLEGFYLGPFRVELCWKEIGEPSPYRVIALDPQPAAQDESTTHPHVQGERLCEGEGSRPIRAALDEGRWLDFFLLVRNVLTTYNSDSPFVALDRWEGVVCHDCDCGLGAEYAWRCCRCEHDLCDDCRRVCGACGEPLCVGCAAVCEVCEDELCHSCAADCERCARTCCSNCLLENQTCEICHEEDEQERAARIEAKSADAAV